MYAPTSPNTAWRQPPPPERRHRNVVLLVPRVGLAVGGGGEVSQSCSGSLCDTSGETLDTSDDSGLILATDLLFRIGDVVRIGPTFTYSGSSAIKIDTDDGNVNFGLGQELIGGLALETEIEASDVVSILFRAQAGASILFVDSDLKDMRLQLRNQCAMSTLACNRNIDPFFAFQYGFGAGLLGHLEKIALRGEVGIHFASYSYSDNVESPPFNATMDSSIDTSRIVVLFGVEI
jgi:hypothetical protein